MRPLPGLADNFRGSAGQTRGSMTGSPINYFRNQAKALKKAVDLGVAQAVERAKAVLHGGIGDFGLMKAQHVVAVEAGFDLDAGCRRCR